MSIHNATSLRLDCSWLAIDATPRATRNSYSSMRATASSCAVCQSSARKFSAARRVIRPNSSLYRRKCSAISAAWSFAVTPSFAAAGVTAALIRGRLGDHPLRGRFRRRRELFGLGAAGHCTGGMHARTDGGLHGIEVAGTHERLMLGGPINRAFLTAFVLLQLRITQHTDR